MVCTSSTFPYFFDLDDGVRVIGFSYVGCAGFFTHLAKIHGVLKRDEKVEEGSINLLRQYQDSKFLKLKVICVQTNDSKVFEVLEF